MNVENNRRGIGAARTGLAAEKLRQATRSHEIRRNDLSTVAAGLTVCTCRVKVNNAGEAVADWNFPIAFARQPSMTFGFELNSSDSYGQGGAPGVGKMPVFAGSVDEWKSWDKTHSRVFTGAKLLILSEAANNISFVCVATATGVAFSGPVSAVTES